MGVGVFGIPFAFAKAGFAVGIGFLFLVGVLTMIVNLMYGEVILRTTEKHQLVGYANKYLGIWAKRGVFFAVVLTTYGALLAYLIVAGDFMDTLISPLVFIPKTYYTLFFFIICSYLVIAGIRTVAKVEVVLSTLFALVIGGVVIAGFPHINSMNYLYINGSLWFLPYGVLLFAFSGLHSIALQRRYLVGREKHLKGSIVGGMVFVAILYLVFSLVVVGVSGDATSPDAISGLFASIGKPILVLASIFGLLAVSTSFILLGSALTDVFILDYKVKRVWALFLTLIPPLLLFSIGIRTFIDVISIVGSLAIALELVILIFIFAKAREKGDRIPEYSVSIPVWTLYSIALILAIGMVYAVIFL